ncbi:monofunctional biosynthetic peptidoglycan transglycosylase [Terrihabitans sp. B22-R8]|uniref:monofunctional biosynthetic peptidoglycan transglycosylase n=1 Tax=Terrihabitans sp. B22-R8 TaxID=3425128 RepID=UPI00403D080C
MDDDLVARRDVPTDDYSFDDIQLEDRRPRSLFRSIVWLVVLLVALPFALTLVYTVIPPVSTLMVARWATLRPVQRQWVPIASISPTLQRAVLASEDARFCTHNGIDWRELRGVLEAAGEDGPTRGASTVTMQVAKNLFLWNGAGYIRKPIEIVLAYWIDLVWTKKRVLEVYLNVAEWGPNGVFGAEAGARHAFGKSATNLAPREAALMAAALPNPIIRNTARPTRGQIQRAALIARRTADISCAAN